MVQLNIFEFDNHLATNPLIENVNNNTKTKYIDYLTFKCWLYCNYPEFTNREIRNDYWEYKTKDKIITCAICWNHENLKQWVSVGLDQGESGWGVPCETIGEVKKWLDRAFRSSDGN